MQTGQSKAGNQSHQAAQVDGDSAITIATQELINENQSVDEYNLRRSNRQGMAHRMQPQSRETMGGGVYFIDRQSGKILKREFSQ